MRKDLIERTDEIKQWVAENWSIPEMYRKLNCSRDTLVSFLKKNRIDYKGNQGLKGRKTDSKRKTYKQLIQQIEEGHGISNQHLRTRLIEDGAKEAKCEICGATEWMGKPIVLELHHKDFNHHNSKFENLQILCSNCHSYVHHYKVII